LVAKREFRGGEKLGLRWQGPQRIVATRSNYVNEVEYLLTKVVTFIHSTRLRFYQDSSLDVTADILAHLAHQDTGYEVRAFRDLKYDAESKAYYVLVSWLGFEKDDNTWEPLLQIYEDLPAEVTSFLANFHVGFLATMALSVLSESTSPSSKEGSVAAVQHEQISGDI
jgi:hypothetical protein